MLAWHKGCLWDLIHGVLVQYVGPSHEELPFVGHFLHRHQVLRHLNILVGITGSGNASNLAEGTVSACGLPRLLQRLLPHLHHSKRRNRLTGKRRAHLSRLQHSSLVGIRRLVQELHFAVDRISLDRRMKLI